MTVEADGPVLLRILSVPGHLRVVRGTVEKMCELVGFDAEATGQVVLGVDEALTNVIRHAYRNVADQPIEIELRPLGGGRRGLRISLRDYGEYVDPVVIRSRDLDQIRPGGLGVHIIESCMDCVEYQPAEGGGTLLLMTKCLPPQGEAESA